MSRLTQGELESRVHDPGDARGGAAVAGVPTGGFAAQCGYCECVESGRWAGWGESDQVLVRGV